MDIEITGQPRKEWLESAEYKSISLSTQHVENRTVTGIAGVTGNVDDVGDIVHRGAFTKTIAESKQRVRHLWDHDFTQPPIARIDDLREIGLDELPAEIKTKYPAATGGLLVRRTYHAFARADEVFQNVANGGLNEMSFGYNAVQKDYSEVKGARVRNVRQARLLDTSDVNWGANPATVARKGALPYHTGPLAPKDTAWDGPAEMAKADPDQLKSMCAWVDSEQADVKSGYKFPYKTAAGKVVFKAAAAGMARLSQADIPDGDRKAVYSVLADVYKAFDETPPDYKSFEIAYSVKAARSLMLSGVDFKAGRRNSAADEAKIRDVIDALEKGLETLEDLLGTAEPPAEEAAESADEGKALTDPAILLALLDLELIEYQ